MINASELRIGNNIYNTHGFVQVVSAKDILDLSEYKNMVPERCQYFMPIPLTEEWLLKFGMRRGNNEYFFIHRGDVGLWNDKGKFTFDYSISMCGNRLHINHVHQLQNLYFALTQNELEIK